MRKILLMFSCYTCLYNRWQVDASTAMSVIDHNGKQLKNNGSPSILKIPAEASDVPLSEASGKDIIKLWKSFACTLLEFNRSPAKTTSCGTSCVRPKRKVRVLRFLHQHAEDCLHMGIILRFIWDSLVSVKTDRWKVIRKTKLKTYQVFQPTLNKVSSHDRILMSRRRAAEVSKLIGVAYTPRIVFIAGVMLRSLHMNTRLCQVFDPDLGYAAGALVAASFAEREWIECMMLGWGIGGPYWSLLHARPPGVAKENASFKFY